MKRKITAFLAWVLIIAMTFTSFAGIIPMEEGPADGSYIPWVIVDPDNVHTMRVASKSSAVKWTYTQNLAKIDTETERELVFTPDKPGEFQVTAEAKDTSGDSTTVTWNFINASDRPFWLTRDFSNELANGQTATFGIDLKNKSQYNENTLVYQWEITSGSQYATIEGADNQKSVTVKAAASGSGKFRIMCRIQADFDVNGHKGTIMTGEGGVFQVGSAEDCEVTFYKPNGTSEYRKQTVTKGSKVDKPKTDYQEFGRLFSHWATMDGQKYDFNSAVTSNLSLRAVMTNIGWHESKANGWFYFDASGDRVREDWRSSGKGLYYLGADEFLLKNTTVSYGGKTYKVDASGALDTSTADGKALYHELYRVGDTNWSGTYFKDKDGKYIAHAKAPLDGVTAYRENGAQMKLTWLRVPTALIDTDDYPEYDALWFFYKNDGEKYANETVDIDGVSYQFDDKGVCLNSVFILKKNDGTKDSQSVAFKYADNDGWITIPNCTFTNGDKVFAGWNSMADGSGNAFVAGQEVRADNIPGSLHAIWKEKTDQEATLVLEKDDGINTVEGAGTYKVGDIVTLKATVKEYYSFAGWTGDLSISSANQQIQLTKAGLTTLKATSKATEYTISYFLDGGALPSGKSNPISYTVETPTFTLESPEKEGYIFAGWAENGQLMASVEIAKGSHGDRSFAAKWVKASAKVNETPEVAAEVTKKAAENAAVKKALDEMQGNATSKKMAEVTAESALNAVSAKAMSSLDLSKVENVAVEVKQTLKDIEEKDGVVTQLHFAIEPVITVKEKDKAATSRKLGNEELNGSKIVITFAVPSAAADTNFILVTHHHEDGTQETFTARISTTGAERTATFSVNRFSTFDVGFTNDTYSLAAIADQVWTGKQITPKVTVKLGNQVADASTYKVTYGENIEGTGTVVVTMNATGDELEGTFRIVKSSGSSDSGSTSGITLPTWVVKDGSWKETNGIWLYIRNGKEVTDQWLCIYNPYAAKGAKQYAWFRFDKDGKMLTGWYTDTDKNVYYLNPVSDGTKGSMATGWKEIEGFWYYFSTAEGSGTMGALQKNTTTPDGYKVDANGRWVK